ncbi:hypothetical protein MCHI_000871 [Candidatus Magnetoovum chiemensis]|nr:hypothetical protein MCHI_000871 [Candidatus Magnetoovum chiemensis]
MEKYLYLNNINNSMTNRNNTILDSNKLNKNRAVLGRICIAASIIAIIGVFDGLASTYRKPANSIDMIIGRSLEMIGKIYWDVKSINDISVKSDSPNLTLTFDEKLFSGYWLGEGMWRGVLKADSYLKPGKYHIQVVFNDLLNIKESSKKEQSKNSNTEDKESDIKISDKKIKESDIKKIEQLSTYTVNVYSDAKTLRESELSLIKRFTGISPWYFSIVFLPIVLISGGLIFIISGKIDIEMAKYGFAEIYRVSRHAISPRRTR